VLTEAAVLKAIPKRGFVHDYVHYGMRGTDAHAAYHVGAAFTTLAQTCPIDYHFPFGAQKVFSNLYALSVGASTKSRKSASISIARDLLKNAVPSSIGDTPGSREALIDSLKSQSRQLVMYSEFGSFLASAEKGYLVPLKTAYTEAWDATPISRSLVRNARSGENTEADPRLSLLAGSTLDYLERHTDVADWTGGFMARFLTFYCKRERTYSIPPGDMAERVKLIAHLKAINESFILRGQCLGFDQHARAMWDDWYFTTQEDDDGQSEIEAAVARGPSQAIKLALLLAWDYGRARSGEHFYVTEEELGPAIQIAKLHTESVLEIGDHLAPDRDMRDRRRVLEVIKKRAPRPAALPKVIRESKLLRRRVMELLETLLEEKTIASVATSEGTSYFITPQKKVVEEAAESAPSPLNVGKVLAFTVPGQVSGISGASKTSEANVATGSDDTAAPEGGADDGVPMEPPPRPSPSQVATFTEPPISAGWDGGALTGGEADEADVVIPSPPSTDPPVTF